jgi:hypothetical protein
VSQDRSVKRNSIEITEEYLKEKCGNKLEEDSE